jgi:hypothetical protein
MTVSSGVVSCSWCSIYCQQNCGWELREDTVCYAAKSPNHLPLIQEQGNNSVYIPLVDCCSILDWRHDSATFVKKIGLRICVQAFTAVNVHTVCVGVSFGGGDQYITLVNVINKALKIIFFLTFHHYGPKFTNLLFHFLLCACLLVIQVLNSSAVTNPMELSCEKPPVAQVLEFPACYGK